MSHTICLTTLLQLNILVSRSRRACLADFGLATALDSKHTLTSMTRPTGTLRWQAPELFPDMRNPDTASTERRSTMATDVYAFALVCYEASIYISLQEQDLTSL